MGSEFSDSIKDPKREEREVSCCGGLYGLEII